MPESEIEDYFSYDCRLILCRYSKDGTIRTVTKSKLKNFFLKGVSLSEPLPGTFRATADGGAFLWCCKW